MCVLAGPAAQQQVPEECAINATASDKLASHIKCCVFGNVHFSCSHEQSSLGSADNKSAVINTRYFVQHRSALTEKGSLVGTAV